MNYKVVTTHNFEREAKPLIKKYRSLKDELSSLITELEQDPEIGTPLGKNCYKIRIAIKSKGKGKSGGGRIITCVKITSTTVHLLSLYDKSEKENISDKELDMLLSVLEL